MPCLRAAFALVPFAAFVSQGQGLSCQGRYPLPDGFELARSDDTATVVRHRSGCLGVVTADGRVSSTGPRCHEEPPWPWAVDHRAPLSALPEDVQEDDLVAAGLTHVREPELLLPSTWVAVSKTDDGILYTEGMYRATTIRWVRRATDVDQVLRELGSDELVLDARSPWTVGEALTWCRRVESCRFERSGSTDPLITTD